MELSINPASQKKIEDLYQKLFKGDQSLKAKKSVEGIFTLGLTGAGKSTITNLLINSKLKVMKNRGRVIIENQDPAIALVKIGQTTKSCTDIPNHVQFQVEGVKYNIFDCPGFLDTNKFDSVIANSYYIYQLFSNIQKIKFLLVIDESTITANLAKQFIKSVCCFLNLFIFDQDFTIQVLARSCVLTITKARNDLENISSQIQQIIGDEVQVQDNFDPQLLRSFLNEFLINQSIQIVNIAEVGKDLPVVLHVFEKLKEQEYWVRNIDQDNIDMKNINFRIGERELQGPQIALAERAFKKCGQSIQQFAQYILQAIEEIQNNVNEIHQNYNFYKSWRKIISLNNLKGNLWDFKVKKTTLNLNKLNHLKYIYAVLNKYEGQSIETTTKVIQNEFIGIMESFAEFVKMNEEQFNILRQFTFILNRKFEESKVLEKLKQDFTLNNRHSFDILKGFLVSQYQQVQQSYVRQLQKISGKSREYYQQLVALCDRYESKIPGIIQHKSFYKNQIANIEKKSNNLSVALKLLFESRELSESAYAEANEQYYLKVDISLNKNIAQFLFNTELYQESLMFYRVIDNTQRILKCFQHIKKKNSKTNTKLFQYNLEEGDYLRQILQFDKAIQRYKTASDLAVQEVLKETANNKILETIKNKQTYIQKFSERMARKQFYYRLSDKFNEEEVIQLMKNAQKADEIEQSQFFVSMRIPVKN